MKLRRRTAGPRVPLQTADRLSALRFRLTALLLVLNVVGLAGMGAVALFVDQQQRSQVATAELRRTASTAVALLHYDSGTLQIANLPADPAAQVPTAVFVYEGDRTQLDLVFAHPAGLPVIPAETLLAPARQVWRTGEQITGTVGGQRIGWLHMLAVPFRHPVTGAVAGAVVVVADPGPGEVAHQRLEVTLIVGGGVFMLLAGVGGSLLAHRGTRPAVQALDQQERFVADAAHELRTPLTVIRALCEAALVEPVARPDHPNPNLPVDPNQAVLDQVLRSTRRLGDSVEALLTRARMVAGLRALERQPFRLDQLAEEVLGETVQPPHTVEVSASPTVAYGDPTLVRIAIRNLGHNAVRHGRIGDEPARVKLIVGAGAVIVEDRGPGPAAPVAEPERFHTEASDGVGLGLAIADWVATLHGGTLRLDPAPGGGTAATLTVPDPPALPAQRSRPHWRDRLSRPGRLWSRRA
ncbi:MAG: HAMP domain-containing histidine kinase [Micromonosporaceae bacterium]|nr:HAMP domain-containing histidine kinase [Micromonosporaceae bacterium]